MDGFGSHTFQWVNAKGERVWVKFHFKTDQGIRCLTSEESARIGGENPQHHQQDLRTAIERGELPVVDAEGAGDAGGRRGDATASTRSTSPRSGPTRTTR